MVLWYSAIYAVNAAVPAVGISRMIATWLDEEWTPLKVHQQLGQAAGAAYVTCRQQGDNDMSSLVLSLSNELLAFNYRDTFVNAFEVRMVNLP